MTSITKTENDETFDLMLSDIIATKVEMDIEGEVPQIALTVQTVVYLDEFIPNDVLHVLVNGNGTYEVCWGQEPVAPEEFATEGIFDLQITADGANNTTTQAQFDALIARLKTVIAQGVAAIKASGIQLDFLHDEHGYETGAADRELKEHQAQLLAAANA